MDQEQGQHKKKRFRFFAILYGVTTVLFLLYLFFISDNTPKTQHELNRKIDNLENKITHTKNQVGNVYTFDQLNTDSVLLEKYAREHLNMHKENEDVFIIIHE